MSTKSTNNPKHIAIIMDGNGRWAQLRHLPRIMGHREGAKTVRKIVEESVKLGIEQLTLYSFSLENWQRPIEEVNFLMDLLCKFVVDERKNIMKNNVRFSVIGRLHMMPEKVQQELEITCNMSKNNTGMMLCLALSYGGRAEIVDTTKKIIEKVQQGLITMDDIDQNLFSENLYQPSMPDPDLVIRTGGDMRISNFLLWQVSYSELWITKKMWPEFTIEDFRSAIESFTMRERRFGKVLNTEKIPI